MLLDNGRTDVLADEVGRAGAALHPLLGVPERLPGLRAHRRPRLRLRLSRARSARSSRRSCEGLENAPTLPWAVSLCGACYEVCPVKIDIPSILVHLRGRVVREVRRAGARARWRWRALARVFASRRALRGARSALAQARRAARCAGRRPAARRGRARATCPSVPEQTFRDWWRRDERARRDPRARPRRAARRPAGEAPAVARAYRAAAGAPERRRRRRASPSASPTTARRCATRRRRSPRRSRGVCARTARAGSACPPGCRRVAPDGLELVEDDGARRRATLDALDGVLTGCALAIAETGTIVLDGGAALGPARADARARPARLRRASATRSSPTCPRRSAALRRRAARPAHLRLGPVAPPRTSSSTASRASTARGASRSCWSSDAGK